MKRICKCVFLIIAFASVSQCTSAQYSELHTKYHDQLQLIDSIRSFISSDLHLYVPRDFYTDWEEPRADSMYTFLYTSYSDRVERDTVLAINYYMTTDSLARAAEADIISRGYHTLRYRTAGMSSTRLNPKLLSYPAEAIAFIVFHEIVHRNIRETTHRNAEADRPIPYRYEESLCDVIANYACVRFARQMHMLDESAAIIQRDVFEEAYSFMNQQRSLLDAASPEAKAKIYSLCTARLPEITRRGNQFHKDRMNYKVNNAYFLRMDDYAVNYFTVKHMIRDEFDLESMLIKINTVAPGK